MRGQRKTLEIQQRSRVLGWSPPRSSHEPCNNLRTHHHHHRHPPVFRRQPKIQRGAGTYPKSHSWGPPSPMGGLRPGAEPPKPGTWVSLDVLPAACSTPSAPWPGPGVKPAACRVGEPSPSHPVSRHSFPLPPAASHPPCRRGRDSWPPSCPRSDMLAELSASLDGPWTHHTVSWSCTCCLQGSHPLSPHPTAQNTEGPEHDPSPPWAWVSGCRGSQADNSPTLHHEPRAPQPKCSGAGAATAKLCPGRITGAPLVPVLGRPILLGLGQNR